MRWKRKKTAEREIQREVIAQMKALRQDVEEHNRLYRKVRVSEKEVLEALAKKGGGG